MRQGLLRSGLAAVAPVAFCGGYTGKAVAGDTYGANSPSTIVVAPQVTKAAAQQSTGLISERIAHAIANATGGRSTPLPGAPRPQPNSPQNAPPQDSSAEQDDRKAGLSAGNEPTRLAVWANASNTWLKGDLVGADFDGTIVDSLVGIDYFVTDRLLIGVVGGYEMARMTSSFNSGTLKSGGFAIAPYAAYLINDTYYLDATVGIASVDYTTSRDNGLVTGETTGHRWFASLNANGAFPLGGNWTLVDTVGFLYVSEDQGAYVESDGSTVDGIKVRLGQMRNTVNLGYRWPVEFGHVTPYGTVRVEYDVIKEPTSVIDSAGTVAYGTRFGATFGLGVNVGVGDNTILSLEASTAQFRENIEMYTVIANIRYRF